MASTLCFQIVDVRVSDTVPLASPHASRDLIEDEHLDACIAAESAPTSWQLTVTVFGRGTDGDYCVMVRGFRPELYYDIDGLNEKEKGDLLRDIQKQVKSSALQVVSVLRYDAGDLRLDAEGKRLPRRYLRVEFPSLFTYKRALWSRDEPRPHHTKPTLESKFFVRTGLRASGWARLVPEHSRRIQPMRRVSLCTHEYECFSLDGLVPLERDEFAPLVIAALDIEAVPNTGFPDASHPEDLICSIGIVKWVLGRDDEDAVRHVVMAHPDCDPIPGTHLHCCADEREMLIKTRDVINTLGVDWLLVYNGRFDFPYMNDRACSGPMPTEAFFLLSKFRFHRCTLTNKRLASGALGDNTVRFFDMPGRANLDVMMWYKINYKKATYALNAVCAEETGETKVDFSYKNIKPYFEGTNAQRKEIAVYNVQDCEILRELCRRLGVFGDQIELSRVSRVLCERLASHGQGIKVVSQMNAKCVGMGQYYEHPFVLNNHHIKPPRAFNEEADANEAEDEDGYEGATVIEPITGYYEKHIVIVCDFTSLYPSIMIAHNLCPSTRVRRDEDRTKPGVEEHTVSESLETQFTTTNPGILPTMLKDTLAARKAAKREKARLEQERDRLQALPDADKAEGYAAHGGEARLNQLIQVFDKRQLALKVSANSVYGFTGASNGPYPCKEVASTTTALGRAMLQESCTEAASLAQTLTRADGEPVGRLTIVYGDTDSIMFTLDNVTTPEDASDAGSAIAKHVTSKFHAGGHVQKKLDYEKCFKNFILFSKKRYCGIKYEPDGLGGARCLGASHSGTANKRRDSCTFVHRTYDAMIEPLLYRSDREACLAAFHEHMTRLVNGNVPYDQLIVTKSVKSNYKNTTLPQLRVVAKQREREAGSEAQSGDRLGMIFVRGPPGSKVCDLAEDADYVKQNKVPFDSVYYLMKQLKTPCTSILELLHPDPAALFDAYEKEASRIRQGVPRLADFLRAKSDKTAESSSSVRQDTHVRDGVEKRTRALHGDRSQSSTSTAASKKNKKDPGAVMGGGGIDRFLIPRKQ